MSYGDYAADVRASLGWLLNQDVPEYAGGVPAMLRYRYDVLVAAAELLAATVPTPAPDAARVQPFEPSNVSLRQLLDQAVSGPPEGPRLMTLMATSHKSEHLRAWQAAARSSVVAERELQPVLWAATPEQRWAAVKDAADTVRAVCVLDARYQALDGWTALPHRSNLATAAVTVSAMAAEGNLDYTIDRLALRTPNRPTTVTSARVAGATQAQRNVALLLHSPPSAPQLRQILVAQLQLSADAARLADLTDHPTQDHWESRTATYRDLVAAARDVDGRLGAAPLAVAAAVQAAGLVADAGNDIVVDHAGLQELERVSSRVDVAVNAAIEHGLDRELYLIPSGDKRLGRGAHGIVQADQRWRCADAEEHVDLRDIARDRLRVPPPPTPQPEPIGKAQRAAYEALLTQPSLRPVSPSMRP
jgi:hypothetical protein